MRIIRFLYGDSQPKLGALTDNDQIYELPFKGFLEIVNIVRERNCTLTEIIEDIFRKSLPLGIGLNNVELMVPIEAREVWAAGVTYERSKDGRNYEATEGKLDTTTFYDKVYNAKRPEIFLKSTIERTAGPEQEVYLRSDSNWQVPEPELGIVLGHKGEILGYTIGNDMSCRDIEGENPLYLTQAKIWKYSCSIGPSIRLVETIDDPYSLQIICRIYRGNERVFEDTANTGQLKRKLEDLASYLAKDNVVLDGTVLLTGTSIVPPNDFTLKDGDRVEIEIPGIGVLRNPVRAKLNNL